MNMQLRQRRKATPTGIYTYIKPDGTVGTVKHLTPALLKEHLCRTSPITNTESAAALKELKASCRGANDLYNLWRLGLGAVSGNGMAGQATDDAAIFVATIIKM